MGAVHTLFGVLVAEPARWSPPDACPAAGPPVVRRHADTIRPSAIRTAVAGRSPFGDCT
jgi:hypothetical protein